MCKLALACPVIAHWFSEFVKPKYLDAHISWSYRNEVAQELAFKDGKTKLHWPNSSHNHMENGSPCAMALDLFQMHESQAIFNPIFYAKLADESVQAGFPISWGGRFKQLGDYDHFQLFLASQG